MEEKRRSAQLLINTDKMKSELKNTIQRMQRGSGEAESLGVGGATNSSSVVVARNEGHWNESAVAGIHGEGEVESIKARQTRSVVETAGGPQGIGEEGQRNEARFSGGIQYSKYQRTLEQLKQRYLQEQPASRENILVPKESLPTAGGAGVVGAVADTPPPTLGGEIPQVIPLSAPPVDITPGFEEGEETKSEYRTKISQVIQKLAKMNKGAGAGAGGGNSGGI